MKLLIATTNPGKFAEIKRFLSDLPSGKAGVPVELVSLKDLGINKVVEETGKTFEENAILKAKFYAAKSGLPTLADDGGFEIDVLNGEPGVKSHRWVHGDKENTDEELVAHTIERMKGITNRSAQLRLVLALALPNGTIHTSEASVRGVIPLEPRNKITPGFPYRSLLFLPEINKYYDHDELTPEETERFNHRKKALDKLKPYIRNIIRLQNPQAIA